MRLFKQEPENKPCIDLLMDQFDYIKIKAFCLVINTTNLQRYDKLEDICHIKTQQHINNLEHTRSLVNQ